MTAPLEDRVRRVLSRTALVPEDQLTADADLAALDIKSLEQIECVLALEDEFHIELERTDLSNLRTVRDVVDAVRRSIPG